MDDNVINLQDRYPTLTDSIERYGKPELVAEPSLLREIEYAVSAAAVLSGAIQRIRDKARDDKMRDFCDEAQNELIGSRVSIYALRELEREALKAAAS